MKCPFCETEMSRLRDGIGLFVTDAYAVIGVSNLDVNERKVHTSVHACRRCGFVANFGDADVLSALFAEDVHDS